MARPRPASLSDTGRVRSSPSVAGPLRRPFRTKADATRWLARVETDRAKGTWVDPSEGRTALDTYAWAWLRGHARLAKRTREIYEGQLRSTSSP